VYLKENELQRKGRQGEEGGRTKKIPSWRIAEGVTRKGGRGEKEEGGRKKKKYDLEDSWLLKDLLTLSLLARPSTLPLVDLPFSAGGVLIRV
jgi:hypothetical protein